MHYLDNAATTQPSAAAIAAADEVLHHQWGNPSSLYRMGLEAEQVMDTARTQVAAAMGCDKKDVYFTAGGTEANNIALLGAAHARQNWGNHIVSTGYEHPSVAAPLAALARNEGFSLIEIAPGPGGLVDPEALLAAVGPKTVLLTAMQVNNETGAMLDVAALAAEVKRKNPRCFVHVDGVQGFGKLPLSLAKTSIDSYAASGHKLHAPKGVGALYLRRGAHIIPPFAGGGQEEDVRPGTENTAFIAALGVAASQAVTHREAETAHIHALHNRLLAGLGQIGGVTVHSPPKAWPGIVIFSMPKGLRSQVMLNYLDAEHDVCVSSGSACSGGAASHTLLAMGLPAESIDAALRVSFCGQSSGADVDALLCGLREGASRLARR